MQDISAWQAKVHALAVEKGWHNHAPATDRDRSNEVLAHLAKIHGEISEAQEEVRNIPVEDLGILHYGPGDLPQGKPEGFGIEMADTVIRIMDTCGYLGIDLQRCMEIKHEYNRTRPMRHGGKKA